MADFFPATEAEVDRRIRAMMDSAEGPDGALFPEHEVPGTPGYNLRRMYTRLFLSHYQELNEAVRDFSPATASGRDLDQWGAFFNLPRTSAQPASGRVLLQSDVSGEALQRLKGTRRLPAGSALSGAGLRLVTTEEAVFPLDDRSVEVAADADASREGVLAEPGLRVDLVSSPLREMVEGEVLSAVDGGRRAETDDQYRFRLARAFRSPASYEGLEAEILADPDVAEVNLTEAAYGPGSVEAFVTPAVAFPPSDLRDRLETTVEGPIRLYVTLPQYEGVALKVRIEGQEPPVSDAVDYVNNLRPGAALVINEVEERLRDAGAFDAQVIEVRRGPVSEEQELLSPYVTGQVTNLIPDGARSRFFTKASWITLCQ